jgi:hypothetical protein
MPLRVPDAHRNQKSDIIQLSIEKREIFSRANRSRLSGERWTAPSRMRLKKETDDQQN